ncbi:zinc finger protein 808-like isoform X2 [Chrysoperla carnea]|uniref:zinc finger protein 808-like isoform X2 n=1 Tax=Chrysoperla carnea TaxID=189513 RepID=UPI001D07593E|nr:zinc finger protein 808-like isoform X2 [Chrysoperla carnea]
MGINCGVPGCESKASETKMHVLPGDNRFKIWATFIGRPDLDISKRKSYRICDKHFPEEMKYTTFHNVTNLKKSALPVNKGTVQNEKPIEEEIERLSDDCNSQSIDLISVTESISENGVQEEIRQTNNSLFVLNTNFILDDTVEIVPVVQQGKLESEIIQESECTTVEKWNNKCITCLKDDVQMETLSSLSLLPEFKELFKYLKIEEFLIETTLNSVCSNCVLQMHNMLSFKRQCEKSVEKLGLFITVEISERVKSPTVHKATQTENEEEISSNFLVQISPDVEEEPDKIEHTEIEQEFDLEALDEKCVSCVNCNENFNNKSWLRRHQILIHGLKDCIQECCDCRRQVHFMNYDNKLKIHNECCHENICSVCDLKFQTIIHLAKHRLLHTLSDPKKNPPLPGIDLRKSRRPHGKVACAKCGKFYKSANLLRSHMQRIHNITKVKIPCTICTRSVYNMNLHLKRHQTHKFQQKILQKKKLNFIESRGLCTYCGKLYARSSLRVHILSVHLNIKNYECMYCGKMFASTAIRNTHIKLAHLKLKRFSCDYCDKQFTRKDAAQKHKLKHTQERPFKCKVCDKLFRYSENIRRHMKQVHGMIK